MGEAFLSSSFFEVILERLASRDFIDGFRRGKLDTLVNKLESTLTSISQVLDEAETKQYESPCVKKWLDDITHAIYETDQLIDEIATDAPLTKPMKKRKAISQPTTTTTTSEVQQGVFSPTFITNLFESWIKELLQNLDSLAKQKDVLGLKGGTACASNEPWKILPTKSLVDESIIYGRDGDKEEK